MAVLVDPPLPPYCFLCHISMWMSSGSLSVALFQLLFGIMQSISSCVGGVGSAYSVIFCFMSRIRGVLLSWMGLVFMPCFLSSATYFSMFVVVSAMWNPWGFVPWVISIIVSLR